MNRKYMIDTEENKQFLFEDMAGLLSFGHAFPAPDGTSYYLGDDGTPWKERDRCTWITSRMAHVYAIGSMMGHEGSEELCGRAVNGLLFALRDKVSGGFFSSVSADGKNPDVKECYQHAFVMLAASSALLAGIPGAKELLDISIKDYDKWFWNEQEGLSCDTWNGDFTQLDDYRGLNANMHTVEAFLALADALGDEKYRERAGRIIKSVKVWAENNNYRIPEHFTKDWQPDLERNKEHPDDPFKPYGATPGHGIEWARLITQWAVSTYKGGSGKDEYIELAENLFNRAVNDAWNADGEPGICYTTDWNGKPVARDRMHWTLAEAINTSAVLYRETGNKKYADNYYEFMEYLDECVLDHVNGSWYHQLDEKNNIKGTVWPGKSDLYHALQSTLIPYGSCDVSIAKDVYNRMHS